MRYAQIRAHPDGSVTVGSPEVIGVGVLATDVQHGSRGGGTTHAVATTSVAGFLSTVDKTHIDNLLVGTETAGTYFFGDGADGAVSLGTTAASVEQYQASSFQATGNVTPMAARNGLVVRSLGAITVGGGASINADGAGPAGGAGGAGGASNGSGGGVGVSVALANQSQFPSSITTLAGALGGLGSNGSSGLPGNPGQNFVGGPPQQFQGGRGGAGGGGAGTGAPGLVGGGGGGTAGAQTGGTANFDEFKYLRVRWDPLELGGFTNTNGATGLIVCSAGSGASGGGAGSTLINPAAVGGAGGAGGAAAGFVYLAGPSITGTGRVSANGLAGVDGGNGANGNATNGGGAGGGGGGGGGSGGVVSIRTMSLGGGITVQANGGSAGAGSTGGVGDGTGTNGGTGHVGEAGAAGQVETAILP
jgi:hypothetical protein